MSSTPPGWYPDPSNPLMERLWDGDEWVDKTRPRTPSSQGAESPTGGWNTAAPKVDTEARPKTYLTSAVISLFLFWPFGIVALVYAMRVDGAWESGRPTDARRYSREASRWTNFALIVFVLGVVLVYLGTQLGE